MLTRGRDTTSATLAGALVGPPAGVFAVPLVGGRGTGGPRAAPPPQRPVRVARTCGAARHVPESRLPQNVSGEDRASLDVPALEVDLEVPAFEGRVLTDDQREGQPTRVRLIHLPR